MIQLDVFLFVASAASFMVALYTLRAVLGHGAASDQRSREIASVTARTHHVVEDVKSQVARLLELQEPTQTPPEPEKLLPQKNAKDEEAKKPVVPELVRSRSLPGDTRCPYCHDDTSSSDDIAVCALCATRHHVACHQERGKCAVYGCQSRAVVWGSIDELREAGILTK